MRPPEEADGIDWAVLGDALGSPELVPQLLRTMYSAEGEQAADAAGELCSCLAFDHRDLAPYPIAVELVPFLVHAVRNLPAQRAELLLALVTVALQARSPHPLSEPVSAVLRAAVPELLPCLVDPDPQARFTTAQFLGLVAGPDPDQALAALRTAYEDDPDDQVRAAALTALTLIDPDQEGARHREREALGGTVTALRLTAALSGLKRSAPPYPHHLVEIVAADALAPRPHPYQQAFLDEWHLETEIKELLVQDADAALAVAADWIAWGNPEYRGYDLAREVDDSWRDREPEILALLVAALPDERDNRGLARLLGVIAGLLPSLSDVDAELRDALLLHAAHPDARVAGRALLALARCGDPVVLREGRVPPARALVPFAGLDDALPQLRVVLRAAGRTETARGAKDAAAALIAALTPAAAAQLVPELQGLLSDPVLGAPAARALGDVGRSRSVSSELMQALARATRAGDPLDRRVAAAVAYARLCDAATPFVRTESRRTLVAGSESALKLLREVLSSKEHFRSALTEVDRLGTLGIPLLPLIENRFISRSPELRLEAARAHWRISGDAELVVPVLAALIDPDDLTRAGLAALELLAEIGTAPEELLPGLRSLATAPTRVRIRPVGRARSTDERLRTAALLLLSGTWLAAVD